MSYTEPSDGGLGLVHEKVEIEMGRDHLSHLDTIVDPVLASELPTALWCARGYEAGVEALLGKVDVILLDSDEPLEPRAGLARAAEFVPSAYVVDLAWLRTTPWRERLAASFDPPDRMARLQDLESVSIRHRPGSGASGLLLAGWLASRLRWDPGRRFRVPGSRSSSSRSIRRRRDWPASRWPAGTASRCPWTARPADCARASAHPWETSGSGRCWEHRAASTESSVTASGKHNCATRSTLRRSNPRASSHA
jgi:glucose-6-phosphate dehydrogenase assembly protein OpcA